MKGAICLLSGLVLTSLPLVSTAGPLQRSDLPASPARVAHVDWDALRTSAVGQFIQDELNKPNAQAIEQQVSGTLTLEANNDEIAGNISSIAQGLVALLKLQQEKPEAVRFAEALSLKQDGPFVVVSLSLPGKDVVALLEADAARKAAKKAQPKTK